MRTLHWLGPGYDLVTTSPSMDRIFERFLGYPGTGPDTGTPSYTLPIDILETEDAYELHATVAGTAPDAVEVTFEDGMLNIAVKAVPVQVHGKLIRQERPWGNWSRKLELPKAVDPDNIAAEFDNGVLSVRIPKAPKVKPHRITIGSPDESTEG